MSKIKNHFHDEICANADKEEESRIRDLEFEHEFDLLVKAADQCVPVDEDQLFWEFMYRLYGDVAICGYKISAPTALHKLYPDSYEEERGTWLLAQDDLIGIGGSFYNKTDIDLVKEDF